MDKGYEESLDSTVVYFSGRRGNKIEGYMEKGRPIEELTNGAAWVNAVFENDAVSSSPGQTPERLFLGLIFLGA